MAVRFISVRPHSLSIFLATGQCETESICRFERRPKERPAALPLLVVSIRPTVGDTKCVMQCSHASLTFYSIHVLLVSTSPSSYTHDVHERRHRPSHQRRRIHAPKLSSEQSAHRMSGACFRINLPSPSSVLKTLLSLHAVIGVPARRPLPRAGTFRCACLVLHSCTRCYHVQRDTPHSIGQCKFLHQMSSDVEETRAETSHSTVPYGLLDMLVVHGQDIIKCLPPLPPNPAPLSCRKERRYNSASQPFANQAQPTKIEPSHHVAVHLKSEKASSKALAIWKPPSSEKLSFLCRSCP